MKLSWYTVPGGYCLLADWGYQTNSVEKGYAYSFTTMIMAQYQLVEKHAIEHHNEYYEVRTTQTDKDPQSLFFTTNEENLEGRSSRHRGRAVTGCAALDGNSAPKRPVKVWVTGGERVETDCE